MAEFQLGVSLKFLNRDLALVIQSNKLIVNSKDIAVKEYLLIPTKLPSSEDYMTFSDLKKDFDKIFGVDSKDSKEASAKIDEQLKENANADNFHIDNINFRLNNAFLYKKTFSVKVEGNEKECNGAGEVIADTDNYAKWEYAFSITIDSTKFFSEFNTMSINSISFSIWNTNREIVKKMMTLGSTEDIFKQLDEPSK
ncbi:hypothetical protein IX39_00010 [Chryseobacterium formosense]|uniref:Uncharacterized protein n=1 Tax=Chryseobacterium formosense TaxID=236814 RepID=A0A085Z3V5_9FLAO|nr:hypothetical protein [Chryseobacterium formosense]KFE99118.1 hypothetical protein IX39_00010 [Chryseobacterium formosense]SFT68603.1 hypothetical protein SAMN05421857_2426 [Chryseobacterium formosense]